MSEERFVIFGDVRVGGVVIVQEAQATWRLAYTWDGLGSRWVATNRAICTAPWSGMHRAFIEQCAHLLLVCFGLSSDDVLQTYPVAAVRTMSPHMLNELRKEYNPTHAEPCCMVRLAWRASLVGERPPGARERRLLVAVGDGKNTVVPFRRKRPRDT